MWCFCKALWDIYPTAGGVVCQGKGTFLGSMLKKKSVTIGSWRLYSNPVVSMFDCKQLVLWGWFLQLISNTIDYILITNLMHWLLLICKILFSSTCFESQVLIFRRIQLYTCSIWCCHCLWEFLVACRYTAWVRTDCRGKVVGGCLKTPTNKMSTWGSKYVEEINILWINNNQCTKLVINI